MGPLLVPLDPVLQAAFQAYPNTLAEIERLQALGDVRLVEGVTHILQIIAVRPIDGAFTLHEDVLEQLARDDKLAAQITDLVSVFIAEQAS